jgi:hypothetical protein
MSFTMSFRTGKDGALLYGERPLYKEEHLRKDYDGKMNIKSELGKMFIDFISLTGDIENSGHPFIDASGDTSEGINENSFFFVRFREYIDLGISNPNFFAEPCFMFFLETQGLCIPAMHHTLVKKDGYKNDAVEDYIEESEDMTPLERAMRGFVAASNEMYDVPLTTYDCETVEDACIASLHFLITHKYNIRKCANCGKYFIPLRSDAIYCDRISPFNKRRTCKTDGAQRTHINNTNEDDLKSRIKRTKEARYMRARRNPQDKWLQKEYNEWKDTLNQKKKDHKSGAITTKQFIAWLEETKRYDE